jgi:hypothetical protein
MIWTAITICFSFLTDRHYCAAYCAHYFQTSIVSRYAQDHFGPEYRQTVGLDFFSKPLELPGFLF